MSSGVVVFSGGLDSTTLVYRLRREGHDLRLVSFNYGQRHRKELEFAKATADRLGFHIDIVDLTGITHLISNSALTSHETVDGDDVRYYKTDERVERKIEVPEGHYAEDNMKLTVVPNRNMIMLSIAAGIAVNDGANFIATGVHAGDHAVYPDCRPQFIDVVGSAISVGNEGFSNFKTDPTGTYDEPIVAPFINRSKDDIAYEALTLGVPLDATWSCYKGGDKHCGRCGTCVERLEAIHNAQERLRTQFNETIGGTEYMDTTEYEDNEYWKTAIQEAKK